MKIDVDFEALAGVPILQSDAGDVVRRTLMESSLARSLSDKSLSFGVSFVDEATIRAINSTYRDKDAVTDVISIGSYSDEQDLAEEEGQDVFVGEIFLNWTYLQESAALHDVSAVYECFYILSHGVLHLIGYEHSPEMFIIQETVATQSEHDQVLDET